MRDVDVELVARHLVCLAALCLLSGCSVSSGTLATVSSPSKALTVSVSLDADGRPAYAVARNGSPVIAESRLGFELTDAPNLERNFSAEVDRVQSHDDTWEQPWGERRFVRNRFNELKLRLTEKTGQRRALEVVFRVYDDGLGFRYEFPTQPERSVVDIAEELTEFSIATPGTAW
jgi:alpha-glucosidase